MGVAAAATAAAVAAVAGTVLPGHSSKPHKEAHCIAARSLPQMLLVLDTPEARCLQKELDTCTRQTARNEVL